jgi:hypothetical protein
MVCLFLGLTENSSDSTVLVHTIYQHETEIHQFLFFLKLVAFCVGIMAAFDKYVVLINKNVDCSVTGGDTTLSCRWL